MAKTDEQLVTLPVGEIKTVDLFAFIKALESAFPFEYDSGVWIGSKGEEIDVYDFAENHEIGLVQAELRFYVGRDAMNENGFRIGTEYFTGRLIMLNRDVVNCHDIGLPPPSICRWVVLPKSINIVDIEAPVEEFYEEKDEFGELIPSYFPPDEEFGFEELRFLVEAAMDQLPKWEFKSQDNKPVWILSGGAIYEEWPL